MAWCTTTHSRLCRSLTEIYSVVFEGIAYLLQTDGQASRHLHHNIAAVSLAVVYKLCILGFWQRKIIVSVFSFVLFYQIVLIEVVFAVSLAVVQVAVVTEEVVFELMLVLTDDVVFELVVAVNDEVVAELIVVAEEVVVEVMVHFAGLEVCEEVDMSELVNRWNL